METYRKLNLLTLSSKLLLQNVTTLKVIKKFPAFYQIRKFMTVFLLLLRVLSQLNPIHII
jgi:hypothetical protein